MGCIACGHVNADAARFCAHCGAPLDQSCGSCQAELRPGARFCDQCGTPVVDTPAGPQPTGPTPPRQTGPTLVAQRKTITVVFGDVGGSTGLGERLDPEAAREVMNQYHRDVLEVIGEHGGTVDKFNGDGFMATFGIPEVAEDDATRAVAAGVEIQRRFDAFAAGVHERHGGDQITLRIGVNTGEIVIAEGDPDIIGDALNVAARLERACPDGRVLVGAETWRLTRQAYAYDPQGEVTVAGRVEPVEIFLVQAALDAAIETATPFVGRDRELDVLRTALTEAAEQRTLRLVTVVGSPGLGKSRLGREAVAALDTEHAVTVLCERAGATTYAPVADLIRAVVGTTDGMAPGDVRAAIERRVAAADDASRIADALVGVLGAGPARSTEETFWSVRRLLETLGREGSTVIVVDDIQWAEPVVLDLLEHLAEWVADAEVLVVCLARPEIRDLRPSLTESGRRAAHVVALEGLDASATATLASRMLGAGELPRELIDRLPASTEGNPLFVRELVKMLVDDEVVRRTDTGWELTIDAEAVEVPPTIQSLLAARLDRLDPDERLVLERASVIGPEFAEGALRALVGDALADLGRVLEGLRRMELVEPTGSYWGDEPLHRFHHVLIRDAAYRRLLKGIRAELHEQVATWTEAAAQRFGAPGVDTADEPIAFHEEQAHRYRRELGPLDETGIALGRRAAHRLTAAADRALARDDLIAAGTLASRALDCLSGDAGERTELLLLAAEAHLGTGDVGTGEALVDELDALAGDDRLRAWTACFRAQLTSMTDPGRLPEAEREATAAAGMLEALRDDAGAAKGHLIRARILVLLGRIGDAEAELDLALTAAREADDNRRITAVLGNAPLAALWGPSPVPRAGGRCLDIVRLLRITTRAPAVEATSMRCQALLEALRGRFDTARKMIARCRRKVDELGLRLGVLETDLFAGHIEFLAGDLDAAESLLRRAYTGLAAMRLGAEAGQAASLLARVLVAKGEPDEADVLVDAAEKMAGRNFKTAAAARVARAELLLARNDPAAAVTTARAAVEFVADTDLVVDQADAHLVLSRALRAAGEPTDADATGRQARALADAKGASAVVGEPPVVAAPQEAGMAAEGVLDPSTPSSADPFDRSIVRVWNRAYLGHPDRDELLDTMAPEYVEVVDRRLRRGETFDREAMADLLASDVRIEWSVVALLGDRAGLCRVRIVYDPQDPNTNDDEGLRVSWCDRSGRMQGGARHDHDDIDGALETLWSKYREQCAQDGVEPVDNAAARTVLRWAALLNLGESDAATALHAADFEIENRRPGETPEESSSLRESIPRNIASGWRLHPTVLAVSGDHRALVHATWVAPVDDPGAIPYRVDRLWVNEVDADGRFSRTVLFAPDRLDDARSHLEQERAITARTGQLAESPSAAAGRRMHEAMVAGDTEAALASVDEHFVSTDHRPGFSSQIGKDRFLENLRYRTDPGTSMEPQLLAARDRVALVCLRVTIDDFVVETLIVQSVTDDGLLLTADTFELSDVDAAVGCLLARQRERCADAGVEPVENAATTATLRVNARINLGDVDGAATLCHPDVLDHREQVDRRSPRVARDDVGGWLDGIFTDAAPMVFSTPLATMGRRALETVHVEMPNSDLSDWWAHAYHRVVEVDEAGFIVRVERFAPDGYEAALACLHRDPEETHQDREATTIARSSEVRSPDDRRRTDLAVLGGRVVLREVHAADRGDAGGDDHVLVVAEADGDGRLRQSDTFAIGDVDGALTMLWQRYREQCAEERVEAIDNAAYRAQLAETVRINLGDVDGAWALARAGAVRENHRRGEEGTSLEQLRATIEFSLSAGWTTLIEPIATHGDRLLLSRAHGRSRPEHDLPAFTTDVIVLTRTDADGRLEHSSFYDERDLPTAQAQFQEWVDALAGSVEDRQEFEERVLPVPRAAPAVEPWDFASTTIEAISVRVCDAMNSADDGTHRESYADGFVWRDHRPMVDGTFDVGGLLATLGPIQHIDRSPVLVGTDRVGAYACTITSQDFTMECINVCWCAPTPDGRLLAIDTFDVDDLDAAVDRYHAMLVDDAERFGGTILINQASRAIDRMNAHLNLHRFDAAAALLTPDVEGEDRRRDALGAPRLVGIDAMRANWDAMVGGSLVGSARTVATDGATRALQTMRFEQSDFVVDMLMLIAITDDGLISATTVFALDQYAEAVAELRRPVTPPVEASIVGPHAGPAVPSAEPFDPEQTVVVCSIRAWSRLLADGRVDQYVDEFVADDFVLTDHRPMLRNVVDREGIRRNQKLVGAASVERRIVALAGERTALVHLHYLQADRDTDVLLVTQVGEDGRAIVEDVFDRSQFDDAVAILEQRLAEDCRRRGAPIVWNAASQSMTQFVALGNLGDVRRAVNALGPDGEMVERRPGLSAQFRPSSDDHAWFFDEDAVVLVRFDRVAADRLALLVARYERDDFVVDWTMVHELGPDLRGVRATNFDLDQYDEAVALFEERADAIAAEGWRAFESTVVRAIERAAVDASDGDVGAFATGLHEEYVGVDHRQQLGNTHGRAEAIEIVRMITAQDLEIDSLPVHVVHDRLGLFVETTMGEFEIRFLRLARVDAGGLLERSELFDLDDLDRAVGVLLSWHAAAGGPSPTTAYRSASRLVARTNLGDLDGVLALLASDSRLEIMGREGRSYFTTDDPAAVREFHADLEEQGLLAWPVRTEGDHLLLARSTASSADSHDGGRLLLVETDRTGQIRSQTSWDAAQLDDAVAELELRAHGLDPMDYDDPSVSAPTPTPATASDTTRGDADIDRMLARLRSSAPVAPAAPEPWDPFVDGGSEDFHVLIRDDLGVRATVRDTEAEGRQVDVVVTGLDGRVIAEETHDADAIDAVLDSFWAHCHQRAEAVGEFLVDNAAARAVAELGLRLNLSEIDLPHLHAPDLVIEEHDIRSELSGRAIEENAALVFGETGCRLYVKPLHADGDRRCLAATFVSIPSSSGAHDFAKQGWVVFEVDDRGRFCRQDGYGLHQFADALARLRTPPDKPHHETD